MSSSLNSLKGVIYGILDYSSYDPYYRLLMGGGRTQGLGLQFKGNLKPQSSCQAVASRQDFTSAVVMDKLRGFRVEGLDFYGFGAKVSVRVPKPPKP